MYGIFTGMDEIGELTLETLNAFSYSSHFIISKMSNEKAADYIFQTLVTLI